MGEKRKIGDDPYAGLPRRRLFASSGSVEVPVAKAITVDEVIGEMCGSVERGSDLVLSREISKNILEKSGEKKDDPKKRRGRPSLGEPWKAEGISKVTWFKREKKRKAGLEGV